MDLCPVKSLIPVEVKVSMTVVFTWPICVAVRPPIWVEVSEPRASMVVAVTPPIWVEVKSPRRSSPLSAEMLVALRLLTWVVVRPASAVELRPPSVVELRLLRSVAVRRWSCVAAEPADLGRGEGVDDPSCSAGRSGWR